MRPTHHSYDDHVGNGTQHNPAYIGMTLRLFVVSCTILGAIFSISIPLVSYAAGVGDAANIARGRSSQTCTFVSASGILASDGQVFKSLGCSPEDLGNFMNALDRFFYRLAIVLAVLMITIGGMQWLMAIGNSSKISNAKETIQQAILGLILALTAVLLLNQIDTRFTNLKSPGLTNYKELGVKCGDIYNPDTCRLQGGTSEKVLGCYWRCSDPAEENKKIWQPNKNDPNSKWTPAYRDLRCKGVCEGGEAGGEILPILGNYSFEGTFQGANSAAKAMIGPLKCLADQVTNPDINIVLGEKLRITEAYPVSPGIGHDKGRHSVGCAVDMTPPKKAATIPESSPAGYCRVFQAMITAASSCGLATLNEDPRCGGTMSANATAGHLHVSMANCP